MRTTPTHVVLLVLTASGVTGFVLTSQPAFLVFGCISLLFILTSIVAVRRPLPTALRSFQGRAVVVQLWGTPPSVPHGAELLVESVNVIGVGLHVFFKAGSSRSIHLKVAQPRDTTLASHRVVITSAKYVQWSGTTLVRAADTPAVIVFLKESSRTEGPASGA